MLYYQFYLTKFFLKIIILKDEKLRVMPLASGCIEIYEKEKNFENS
jgi:hypothetical protein